MISEEIFCERAMIENIASKVQRDFLINQYCRPNFFLIDMVDIYTRVFKSNAFMTLFINSMFILMFWNIFPPVIYRMFCSSVLSTLKSLRITKVVASITITLSLNLIPNIYTLFRESSANIFTNYDMLQWVLGETLIVLNLAIGVCVIAAHREIVMSKWIFFKDSIFIFVTLIMILIFGYIGKINYIFPSLLVSLFVVYLFISFLIEYKRKQFESAEVLEMEKHENMNTVLEVEGNEDNEYEQDKFNPDKSVNDPAGEEDEEDFKEFEWEKFLNEIKNEVTFQESGFIMNCILVPPMVLALLSIPYDKNPLMKTLVKYVIVFNATIAILFNFEFEHLLFWHKAIISVGISVIYFILNLININQKVLSYLIEFFGYLSAISYTHLLLLAAVDSLSFIGFYFSGNILIVFNFWPATISGSFILFTAIGYSFAGYSLLGIYSCYSSVISILTLYLGIVMFIQLKSNITEFQLFEFSSEMTGYSGFVSKMYTIVLLGLFGMINMVQLVYLTNSDFRLKKVFGIITAVIYCLVILGLSIAGLTLPNSFN